MAKIGNYDAVASFYDQLAQFVFGKDLREAQTFLLSSLKPPAEILIIGGGTGWILEEIEALQMARISVTYLEISANMIALSRKRNFGSLGVTFIQADIRQVELPQTFDVMLTPFLFDNFSQATAEAVFLKLHRHLKESGLWLFTDFQKKPGNLRASLMLRVMYGFFGFLCRLETKALPNLQPLFGEHGYTAIRRKTYSRDFIESVVYKKQRS